MMLQSATHSMYCPNRKCGVLIILDTLFTAKDVQAMRHGWHTEVDVSSEATSSEMLCSEPIGCPRCQQPICFKCRSEWHEGMSCHQYQYFASKIVDEVTKFCRKMKWMRCFQCGHVVEKKTGCNHITCMCGSQFCYICGSQWGQCKCQVISEGHALRHNRGPAAETHRCPHCSQAFDSVEELRVHIRMCQANQARKLSCVPLLEEAATTTNGTGAFECASCGSRFSDYGHYKTHRRECVKLPVPREVVHE